MAFFLGHAASKTYFSYLLLNHPVFSLESPCIYSIWCHCILLRNFARLQHTVHSIIFHFLDSDYNQVTYLSANITLLCSSFGSIKRLVFHVDNYILGQRALLPTTETENTQSAIKISSCLKHLSIIGYN